MLRPPSLLTYLLTYLQTYLPTYIRTHIYPIDPPTTRASLRQRHLSSLSSHQNKYHREPPLRQAQNETYHTIYHCATSIRTRWERWASRVRPVSSRLLGDRHGLLYRGRIHLGGDDGRLSASHYRGLQYSIRNLPSWMLGRRHRANSLRRMCVSNKALLLLSVCSTYQRRRQKSIDHRLITVSWYAT
jgi:hypothetical protein